MTGKLKLGGLFLFSIMLFQSCFVAKQATVVRRSDMEDLRNGGVVIGTKECPKDAGEEYKKAVDAENQMAVEFFKKNWTFCPIVNVLPQAEAWEFVKDTKGYFMLTLEDFKVQQMSHNTKPFGPIPDPYRPNMKLDYSSGVRVPGAVSYHKAVCLYVKQGQSMGGHALRFFIPFTAEEKLVNPISLQIALNDVQRRAEDIESGKLRNSFNVMDAYRKRSKGIKDQTLLIPEFMMHRKMDEQKVAKLYPHKFEICSNEKYNEVILNHTEGYVYPAVNTTVLGTENFQAYSSATGECLALMALPGALGTNIAVANNKDYDELIQLKPKQIKKALKRLR
ncbi:MAG: hypothetical protein JXR34_09875 [Bacteroidales bacterium]|nr:hypothetical protein [Bacteroidales bacterium]